MKKISVVYHGNTFQNLYTIELTQFFNLNIFYMLEVEKDIKIILVL